MCLTDRKQPHPLDKNYVGALIPLLSPAQLDAPQEWIQTIKEGEYDGEITFIPITIELAKMIGDNAFALKIEDESMDPELRPDDVLIVNPDATPKPGNIVVVKSDDNPEAMIRRYKQLSISTSTQQFELLAINKNWAAIQSHELEGCKILGTVINLSGQIA